MPNTVPFLTNCLQSFFNVYGWSCCSTPGKGLRSRWKTKYKIGTKMKLPWRERKKKKLGEIRQKYLPGCVSKWHQAFMEVKAVRAKFLSTLREPSEGSEVKGRAICLVCLLDVYACHEHRLCISLQNHSTSVCYFFLRCRINICISCITLERTMSWFSKDFKKRCVCPLVWRQNICANERNTQFPAQALSFCWNLNMKLTTKSWPNSVLVMNSQTPLNL